MKPIRGQHSIVGTGEFEVGCGIPEVRRLLETLKMKRNNIHERRCIHRYQNQQEQNMLEAGSFRPKSI